MNELIKSLSVETGLSAATVLRIIYSAPNRYKEYFIGKKNGGMRRIAQPAREVKLLQRAFIEIVLKHLPVHSAATAYIKGHSIRDNAERHRRAGPILKMDFKDFFPSIVADDWASYCNTSGCLTDPEEIHLSSLLLFHRPRGKRGLRLAIGAPSSPMLSNLIMHQFDAIISDYVANDKVIYTRYADDLTFSALRTGYLTGVIKAVRKTIKEVPYPTLQINKEKTTYVTKKYHRVVTGLTLSNDGRVTVGRERKRSIRVKLDYYKKGRYPESKLDELAGLLAFVKSAEPSYYLSLLEQHGYQLIETIASRGGKKQPSQL